MLFEKKTLLVSNQKIIHHMLPFGVLLQLNPHYLESWGQGWMIQKIKNNKINEPRTKLNNNLEKGNWSFTWQRSKSEPIMAQWNALY